MQQLNITVALGLRHLGRSIWIGLGVFIFLALLDMAFATDQVSRRWLGNGYGQVLPWHTPTAMLRAAVVIAGFAATYFAVVSMNDPDHRATAFEPTVQALTHLEIVSV